MKKIFYILILPVVILLTAWAAAEYLMYYRNPQKPEVAESAILLGESSVPIGGMIQCYVDCPLPCGADISGIEVNTGKFAVSAGNPSIKTVKYGPFSTVKRITVSLRAISPGETADADFSFSADIGKKSFSNKVSVPLFKIAEPTVQQISSLQLAEKEVITPEKHTLRNIIIVCAVLLAAAAVLTVLAFTCLRKKTTPLSEWEKTRQELSRLKSDISESRVTPENGFIRLTDLVRGYLEKRFGLPATRRTTPEFIEDISHNGNFVPEDRKPFLKNFLEAADQVKFAMAYPEKELLNKALTNAEALIDATRPNEESKKDV